MKLPHIGEQWTTVSGRRVHLLCGGDSSARTLVLLHGGGTNSALLCWRHCLSSLAGRHRVVAPDFPGFGESEQLERCALSRLARFLDDYLAAAGIDSPILVAHSMAGLVALQLAAARPRKIRGLVLVDALGLGSQVPYRPLVWLTRRWSPFQPALLGVSRRVPLLLRLGLRYNLASRYARTDPLLIRDLQRELDRPRCGQAWKEFLEDQAAGKRFRADDSRRLEELQLPVLLIHGTQDRLVPIRYARRSVKLLTDGRLVELSHCGHWPSRERPGKLTAAVLEFAKEIG